MPSSWSNESRWASLARVSRRFSHMAIRRVDAANDWRTAHTSSHKSKLLRRTQGVAGLRFTWLPAYVPAGNGVWRSAFRRIDSSRGRGRTGTVPVAAVSPHLPEYWVEVEPEHELGIYEGRRRVGDMLLSPYSITRLRGEADAASHRRQSDGDIARQWACPLSYVSRLIRGACHSWRMSPHRLSTMGKRRQPHLADV